MKFLKFLIKMLIILAMVLLMAVPFIVEFFTFRRDKSKKITYKRFRIVIYTVVYIIAITIVLYLLKEFVLWLETLSFVRWIANKIALSARFIYCCKVLTAILVNFAVGLLYCFFSKFVRIGLKKKNLVVPKKKDGTFNWRQKLERKVIKFFHTETWFFVGSILKYFCIVLSAVYALVFIAYQLPAVFGAEWIPYRFISMLFSAGYIYPTISLLGLWEMYFFLEGIKRIEDECPELLHEDGLEEKPAEIDLNAIDEEIRKQFKNFYACDVGASNAIQAELSTTHNEITEFIAQAVENDKRNPQARKDTYLSCVDKLVGSERSLLINGSFFSEFSMYFFRYLSAVVARGDNVVFVCNSDAQIDAAYDYIVQGLAEISSLYCKGFRTDSVNFDDPIWRVVKISGDHGVIEEASIDENNILVTSLSYLCSTRFENEHSRFITMIDAVVFVDTLKTVNTFNRQLAILNTHLKHITQKSSMAAKNGNDGDMFRARYMYRQIRYICFDDTRTPGLDKVMKNMLAVDFDSADVMNYNNATIVRCYNYEGKISEDGRRDCVHFLNSDEEIGAVMNMAALCLAKGASKVNVFVDDVIPYENISETIAANLGQISIKADGNNILINKHCYNPNGHSVIIAMDSGNNLPATIRRYMSMVSDKPTLVIIFSRPYMLRDFYIGNIDKLWSSKQLERIPVEENTKRDVAQKILVKANAGGITKEEILRLAAGVPQLAEYALNKDVNAILRDVLEAYGISQDDEMQLFRYFEYTSVQDIDQNGGFNSEVRVFLRRQGKLFEAVNGRDMVVMVVGDSEIMLPMPRSRLSQNYIAGQNFVHNGAIYHIQKIDTNKGCIYANLAVGGKNDEAYQYIQSREYRIEMGAEQVECTSSKHVVLNKQKENIQISDAYVSVFRAPMEVITHGYYKIDPHTLDLSAECNEYYSINDPGNDMLAKQTYRRYGKLSSQYYSTDLIFKSTNLNASEKGALVMAIRICGQFGPDVNKTMLLAATMLNELLHSMFPSVADSISVCPVLHGAFSDEESKNVLQKQPKVVFTGGNELISDTDFELVIIEDCATDLGVISVLMSAGDDILNTLFSPIFNYLKWYSAAEEKSKYLYYGLDHEPSCFDFISLEELSGILGDDKHDLKFVDLESIAEYDICNFCGKRYGKGEVIELDDGRKMCKTCAESLVGNNKKILKAYLERAKIFLESTYGIALGDDYEFCFESTVKITNTLKQNRGLIKRGSDVPLKAYIDNKKKVHVEYSIPEVNLSELLVRELTYVWQLQHLPNLPEDLAEGHIALVAIQYLRFLNQNSLASTRSCYYESNGNISGEGYRKLVRALLENPQYNNNPFRYLLERSGVIQDDQITPPSPRVLEVGAYGLPYTPQQPDRVLNGNIEYFYYSRLTATFQKAYDVILEGIRNHQDAVEVEGCTFADVCKITDAIAYDHPELFWYKTISMVGQRVNLLYGASAEEVAVLQKRIDEVVPKYLEGIDDTMSAYDVALRVHAKVIASVDYDTIALNKQKQEGGPAKDQIDYLRTICGVFLDGKAVCEGYARAMQYLLQKCGIECAEIVGYIRKETGERDGAHAWNILKIDGDYYYVDTTWDDSSNTVQTVKKTDLGFDYFCITTDELIRTRDVDLCPTAVPNCDATRGNYFYHNDYVLETYDLNKIKVIAQIAAKNKCKAFTFKCKTKALFDQTMSQLCAVGHDCYDVLKVASKIDKQILANTYSYTYDKNIWTITVKFKYK